MAEIFISYARPDRPRAQQLAQALERTGWSVWWDREIPPGRSFDEVIEEALSQARCVIVVWSETSIRSEWVKTEAAEAAQRRILVPILADGARIPLEFRRIQAAAIGDWRDLEGNEGWSHLCDAVAALIDSPRRVPSATTAAPARRIRPARVAAGALAALVVVLAAGVSAYLATREPPNARVAPIAAAATRTPAPAPVVPAAVEHAPAPAVAEVRVPPGRAASLPSKPLPPARNELAAATTALVAQLDREPINAPASSFDVTLFSGVFRNQAGRLSVSTAGVRFHETGGSGRAFELSCASLLPVRVATIIADRDQRLLELRSEGEGYRVVASDTAARDSIRATIKLSCGR